MAKVMLCPLCHKQAAMLHIPFCSHRCAQDDLGRWFRGEYTVPVVEENDVPESIEALEDS